ncbi:carbohydrate sulfotransferase 11-like [Lingula anatina]|uniref:Carbohydrate sulfotransferase n=1 Tax=Lingula anatina TaxID=7574 RepID=A0A1S3K2J2_LINAN|nr:carbohydrate sulfotransferase 11-like [Lingula anatina]XP_013416858.1 carbohydrate sulfotransferase 11-like [Lingula anatina]|eukprot:XP_013414722.1 carbohydrate sulfotransferase 11-like [Lingula anatina]
MKARRKILQDACPKNTKLALATNASSILAGRPFLWVDDRHSLIYCEIPKVGCTNFKRLMYGLTANADITEYKDIGAYEVHYKYQKFLVPLSDFSEFGIKFRLANYLKVVLVRHPFERLVSAYRNKLEKLSAFSRQIGAYIKPFMRSPGMKSAPQEGDGISFAAFVKYINVYSQLSTKPFNPHWRTYNELCNPCDVKYDVIVRYETIQHDVSMLLKLLRVAEKFKYPDGDMSSVSSAGVWRSYFANVPSSDLNELKGIYKLDAKLFNYTFN